MDPRVENLIQNWQKRNIAGFFCHNKEEALVKLLQMIPGGATVGISGSQTLDQMKVVAQLQMRGTKVFNQYAAGLSKEESLQLRKEGLAADFYLASANAISETGELVFFSAFPNRIMGVSGARNVIIVCGINKISVNLEQAIIRAREIATPLNCKRLNWPGACLSDGRCRNQQCLSPEYKRMCCQMLVIEAENTAGRMQVVLVGESLGF